VRRGRDDAGVRAPVTSRFAAVAVIVSWMLAVGSLLLLAVAETSGIEDDLFHHQDAAMGLVFPLLGWLVIRRQGSHPVGWTWWRRGSVGRRWIQIGWWMASRCGRGPRWAI
jgi:hypothetical protein